ncbi:hypothetical protein BV898_11974 [Hypsibius exemplaris]|uniref:G-protein coupled receptors family 1 profile domain-containing protein n=1 Tax=Hypsibius exemplaris TaxID=2072580 RepID=A0A1W0WF55_HYPEX|nr:hypothetical protein BV898_11974 [Hypsibius exemplaris]
MSNASGNDTKVTFPNATALNYTLSWSVLGVFQTTNICASFIGNVFIFCLLVSNRQLRTPFNLFILSLACANIVIIFMEIMDALHTLADGNWTVGEAACTCYIYVSFGESGVVFHQHALIAVNRMWAVVHPMSYRSWHTKRLARGLITGVWAFALVFWLPYVIMDLLFFRLTIQENGQQCQTNGNAQFTYSVIGQVIFYLLPVFVQMMVFPVVYCTQLSRTLPRKVTPTHPQRQRPIHLPEEAANIPSNSITAGSRNNPNNLPGVANIRKSDSSGLGLLAILSLCAIVSWLPSTVTYFLMSLNPDIPIPDHAFDVFEALLVIQTTADPIIFLLSLNNLREEVRRLGTRVFSRFQT